jgi:hypothetical protein
MKYEKILSMAKFAFLVVAIAELLEMLFMLFAYGGVIWGHHMMTREGIGGQNSFVSALAQSVDFHALAWVDSAKGFLTFLVFLYLYQGARSLQCDVGGLLRTLVKLKTTVWFLVLMFAMDGVRLIFLGSFEKTFDKYLPQDQSQVSVLMSSFSKELTEMIFPNFSGSSSIVLALLLYMLARFMEERLSLTKEVEALKEDSSLTV